MDLSFLYIVSPGSNALLILLLGMGLDTLLGDPRWLPHPIRFFGWQISRLEKQLNTGRHRRAKGMGMALLLILSTYLLFFAMETLLSPFPVGSLVFSCLVFFFGISNHSLIQEALRVERKLQSGDLPAAREQLSWIVGRDTQHLSPSQIRIATLETLAENLSDGVIAPIFYFALGGAPLMMSYKMINTLDSMVGYKNDRFREFGCFSARMDDVANYLPARITALLIVLLPPSFRALSFVFKYGNKHASPNSGYPEAAMAGQLNCRMGGPNTYGGRLVEKPYIGTCVREITHRDLLHACYINALATLLFLLLLAALRFYVHPFLPLF